MLSFPVKFHLSDPSSSSRLSTVLSVSSFLHACLSLASVFPVFSVFSLSIYYSATVYIKDPVLQLLSEQSSAGITLSFSLTPLVSHLSPPCHNGKGSVDSPLSLQQSHMILFQSSGYLRRCLTSIPSQSGILAPGQEGYWPCSDMPSWREINSSKDIKDGDWVGASHETMKCMYPTAFPYADYFIY